MSQVLMGLLNVNQGSTILENCRTLRIGVSPSLSSLYFGQDVVLRKDREKGTLER